MDLKIVFLVALLAISCASVPSNIPPCACAKIYAPVCSSDWVTSNNQCEFACRATYMKKRFGKEIRVLRAGRCKSSHH